MRCYGQYSTIFTMYRRLSNRSDGENIIHIVLEFNLHMAGCKMPSTKSDKTNHDTTQTKHRTKLQKIDIQIGRVVQSCSFRKRYFYGGMTEFFEKSF